MGNWQQQGGRYDRSRYTGRRTDASRYDRGNYTHAAPGAHATYSRKRQSKRLPLITGFAFVGVLAVAIVAYGALSSNESAPSGTAGTASVLEASTASDAASEDSVVVSENLPTPYIAESEGIYLHSAVAAEDLTEILIHNASYGYACEITTQLTEATNTEIIAAHGTGRDASEQPTGNEWLTGEFIRCFRSTNAGPRMSAIDCGAAVGSTVYAPVSGTVVKVKEYDLYDNPEYPDIQIHIQPEGRDDLDVVLIHLQDSCIEEGDTVEGGVTPIAKVRDVYAYIGESMQLKDYTAEGDNGNHTHIQVNDATNKDYHGLDSEDEEAEKKSGK